MENNFTSKANFYVDQLDELKSRTGDLNAAIAIMREVSKDLRMDRMAAEKTDVGDSPATEKQKRYLEKLNVDFDENISRKEASDLIDIAKQNSGA